MGGEREEEGRVTPRLLTWAMVVSFPERRGYQTRLELEVCTVSCCVLDVLSLRCLRDPGGAGLGPQLDGVAQRRSMLAEGGRGDIHGCEEP